MDWYVNLEWKVSSELPEESFDGLMMKLAPYMPALAASRHHLRTSLALEAADAEGAISAAVAEVRAALEAEHLDHFGPVGANVASSAEMDAELAQDPIPRLVGIAEIARYLRISRQRASMLAKSGVFPPPVTRLAAGPVWLESSIFRFASNWERLPGRPKR